MDPFLFAAFECAERRLLERGIPIGSVLEHSGAMQLGGIPSVVTGA